MTDKKILITGGTGFLGIHLSRALTKEGYSVNVLSRKPSDNENTFQWNIENGFIDPRAFEKTETIVHLAGESISQGRWTAKRKKEIIESRTLTAQILFDHLQKHPHQVKTFISASGIGIYGDAGDEWLDEHSPEGNDFPAEVCRQWEKAALKFADPGIRVVILRIGIVLAGDGGALPQFAWPVKLFVGSPFGTGKQYLSWIHIDDLCSLFLKAMEDDNMRGTFNAVAPNPVSNKEFMKSIAKAASRPLWPVNIPSVIFRMLLGEKAIIVTGGQRVSAEKIRQAGFKVQFEKSEDALKNIFRKSSAA